ncbi:MAG: proline racemase family protein [Limnohabitans sp.]|nr:proline racemase family protein [Limnohabitans sp.]
MQIRRFIDSHTEGEPTRVLLAENDAPFGATLPELLASWSREGQLTIPPDMLALASNPRAADATVCALVCAPSSADASCGVLFWNAAGPLGMCGHATIGLARTLSWIGRPLPPAAKMETRVGLVTVETLAHGSVRFANVASYVFARDVEIEREHGGVVRGDIAWGGNWFFIVRLDGAPSTGKSGRLMRSLEEELAYANSIARGLVRVNLRAGPENNGLIDHVALIFQPSRRDAHARNFVLCPNGTFDRSPCGTGTSALLASLAARGELAPNARWRQESAIGSVFEASYVMLESNQTGSKFAASSVIPQITGRAFVVAEGNMVRDAGDPSQGGGWVE